ncbi:hypothetical protein CcaverHIS002_0100950 [Cutaneotrichosporon cavernicola]|uniref:Transcription elongation factor 1 homolog n=1 Tax=Cutaneotrichosporon cavernicola TaxID=279322 RepID=A0AA48I5E9_9TREE|nr:uncharacterized protein CcaverHIS019_0100930 [Cutaneotrichosporon cavernicola]BEI79566.1 hypothetical protein CcaverHIS002_0100950 [Cutaneotrichosporon cavernicola]BEI87375.1 hypothetical protein CcaverHIS019_0100930 [Cutaneotrichosporon cavernicola]BEI95144.1 hypothetical protein CcaverHIS631_0100930 [Cutaneotrichosporon cavernicola]BEJ02918.1 hypothetical protein CcaverHIS641_0100930 [Cutaneotrichosporon cavernicola]
MGKRKSAKKPQTKRTKETLATTFKCLFCHHDNSVNVKIDKSAMFGHLTCKVCGQKFTTPINNLSAAVDVYCDWVDACEEARQKQPKKFKVPKAASPPPAISAALNDEEDDEDDDYDLDRALEKSKRKTKSRDYDDSDDDRHRRKQARRAYDEDDDDE